jgi:hypothetical protein
VYYLKIRSHLFAEVEIKELGYFVFSLFSGIGNVWNPPHRTMRTSQPIMMWTVFVFFTKVKYFSNFALH